MKKCENPSCTTKQAGKLLKCSGCMRVAYCSTSCQKAHWKDHKVPCKQSNPKEAQMEKEVKNAKEKGIPICLYCGQMTLMCECEDLDPGEGVVWAMRTTPLTYEERDKNYNKFVKRMRAMKTAFPIENHYRDSIKESKIITFVMQNEMKLREMMQAFIGSRVFNKFLDIEKISHNELAVICTTAISKFVDFEFNAMGKFEFLCCYCMYDATNANTLPKSTQLELGEIQWFIKALQAALEETKNWPQ